MWRFSRKLGLLLCDRQGQVLPVVLMMMLAGGLLIVPGMTYVSTGLNGGRVVERNVKGLYSADAGVEHAIWRIKNNPPASYPDTYEFPGVNGMPVTVEIRQVTQVYGLEVGSPGVHSDTLTVESGLAWDQGLAAYVYTVTITNNSSSNIKLDRIVVKVPEQFEYLSGYTAGSFTTADPDESGTPENGVLLSWDFPTPRPGVGGHESGTHTFRLTGPPEYTGGSGYVWVVAEREDIGTVGQAAYGVTATARQGSSVVSVVEAGVLVDPGTGALLVSSWEVRPR